jgi:hypothetical protein
MDVRRRQTLTGLGAIPLPPQLEQGSYGDSFSPHFAGFISTFWPVPKQYLHVVSFGIDASSNQPSLAVRGGSRGLVGPATHSRTDLSTPERQWLCCVPSPPSWSLFLGQRGDTGSVECWRPARVQRASGRGLANEGVSMRWLQRISKLIRNWAPLSNHAMVKIESSARLTPASLHPIQC